MEKPTYPPVRRWKPEEIKEIRQVLRKTQAEFARYFPVSVETIKKWESGRRIPYGPSSTILQQLKKYTDHVTEQKRKVLKSVLKGKGNV